MVVLLILLAVSIVVLRLVMGFAPALFIIFLILKLCGVIAWSWLAVCIPLIVMGASIVLLLIVSIVNAIVIEN